MQETFFTSKQAAEITGCTLRQLQYWREKGVVVPVIGETGTGRSIYYSKPNLMELAAMLYFLSMGLNFDIASTTLKTLKDKEPELFESGKGTRWMLQRDNYKRSLELVEFELEQAIAQIKAGQPVIPVWLDTIYERIASKLKN
ncbi:MerR family transcriptional regulator [Nostoc sp. FACHB-110]|uniref:MerR family transcriptional regulator n=1 Tax=Nostoc sp. FACHB-110 TaxID=2692834 RepID=UPI0016845602|nr:MerR family transcriptional regulator [Nostoc sp. FACHB-110]MBD2438453.1 MerR family transcriptional regulator [Nostoc sp. FACHB-110]